MEMNAANRKALKQHLDNMTRDLIDAENIILENRVEECKGPMDQLEDHVRVVYQMAWAEVNRLNASIRKLNDIAVRNR